MVEFNKNQSEKFSQIFKDYLISTKRVKSKVTPFKDRLWFNEARITALKKLTPILNGYTSGKIDSKTFILKLGRVSELKSYWGMTPDFLKKAYRADESLLDDYFRKAILPPKNEDAALKKLDEFEGAVARTKDKTRWPYLISFFWHVKAPDVFPALQRSGVDILSSANLCDDSNMRALYSSYWNALKELSELFTKVYKDVKGKKYSEGHVLYHIEHALYYSYCSSKSSSVVPVTPSNGFHHSDDYRYIRLNDEEFTLTSRQASIIENIHTQRSNGITQVSTQKIMVDLGIKSSRLRDSFKSNPKAFKALIRSGDRSGMVSLNI